jgi:hypothetical protein
MAVVAPQNFPAQKNGKVLGMPRSPISSKATPCSCGDVRYRPGGVQSLTGRRAQPSVRGSGTVHEDRNRGSQ